MPSFVQLEEGEALGWRFGLGSNEVGAFLPHLALQLLEDIILIFHLNENNCDQITSWA